MKSSWEISLGLTGTANLVFWILLRSITFISDNEIESMSKWVVESNLQLKSGDQQMKKLTLMNLWEKKKVIKIQS